MGVDLDKNYIKFTEDILKGYSQLYLNLEKLKNMMHSLKNEFVYESKTSYIEKIQHDKISNTVEKK